MAATRAGLHMNFDAVKRRTALAWMFAWYDLKLAPWRLEAALCSRRARSTYRVLTESELRTTRRSDTVFIFGSGWSINEVTPPEVAHFEEHDTLSFNWFPHQRLVRADYHLIREVADHPGRRNWDAEAMLLFELIRENPCYRETIFLVQRGFRAVDGNLAVGRRLLPEGARIFRWYSARNRIELGRSFRDGLTHTYGTLAETVNFAALLGWSRIVLVGVDLYDRRYFWLPRDERIQREDYGLGIDDPHPTAVSGIIDVLSTWRATLAATGIELSIYNPRSLLAGPLPVYRR